MAEINEGFLDTLKKAINTSTATGKARAAGDWFREKVKQAGASARMKAITPSQLLSIFITFVQKIELSLWIS